MYKLTNNKIIAILAYCMAFNSCVWLFVGLLSLPASIQEFSIGFLFSITILCTVLLAIPESKRLKKM